MTGELVSVVIPTFNYGRYVADAVASVLGQTHRPYEVIVVDDGSTDDTFDRLRPYLSEISYIYQTNQGPSVARNAGVRAASGSLIAFLDADDLWHPRRLEIQVRYLATHPATGLVASGHLSDLGAGWPEVTDLDEIGARPVSVREMLIRARFGTCGVLVRRACLDAVGLFDTALRGAEDRDLWIRIAARYPVAKLDLPLFWYRPHAGSATKAAELMERDELQALRRCLSAAPEARSALLRCKVLSYTLKSAAVRYRAAGCPGRALNRLVRSLALWPLPYRADERITRFERVKMVVLSLLQLAGVRGA